MCWRMLGRVTIARCLHTDRQDRGSHTPWLDTEQTKVWLSYLAFIAQCISHVLRQFIPFTSLLYFHIHILFVCIMFHAHRDADKQIDFSTFSQSLPAPPSPHRITPTYRYTYAPNIIYIRIYMHSYTDRQTDRQTHAHTHLHTQHTYTQHTHMHSHTHTHTTLTHTMLTHTTHTHSRLQAVQLIY